MSTETTVDNYCCMGILQQ